MSPAAAAVTHNLVFSTNTLLLFSPITKLSSSFPLLPSLSPPQFLSLSLHTHSPSSRLSPFPIRSLSPSNDAVSSSNDDDFQESFEDDPEFEDVYDGDDDESDSQDFGIDVDALEQEAKAAVREYSSTLSRELIIRTFFFLFYLYGN